MKSVVVAVERPPIPKPGTSWTTLADWKASSLDPPEEGSMAAWKGPAPSWLTWWRVMVRMPLASGVGRPLVAPLPAALDTPSSVVPRGVFVPVASVAPLLLLFPVRPPRRSPAGLAWFWLPPVRPPRRLPRRPRVCLLLLF